MKEYTVTQKQIDQWVGQLHQPAGVTSLREFLHLDHSQQIRAVNTDFSGKDLSGADLSGIDLTNANFSNAIVQANLTRADLNGADFTNANINEAILIDVENLTPAQLNQSYTVKMSQSVIDSVEALVKVTGATVFKYDSLYYQGDLYRLVKFTAAYTNTLEPDSELKKQADKVINDCFIRITQISPKALPFAFQQDKTSIELCFEKARLLFTACNDQGSHVSRLGKDIVKGSICSTLWQETVQTIPNPISTVIWAKNQKDYQRRKLHAPVSQSYRDKEAVKASTPPAWSCAIV